MVTKWSRNGPAPMTVAFGLPATILAKAASPAAALSALAVVAHAAAAPRELSEVNTVVVVVVAWGVKKGTPPVRVDLSRASGERAQLCEVSNNPKYHVPARVQIDVPYLSV